MLSYDEPFGEKIIRWICALGKGEMLCDRWDTICSADSSKGVLNLLQT